MYTDNDVIVVFSSPIFSDMQFFMPDEGMTKVKAAGHIVQFEDGALSNIMVVNALTYNSLLVVTPQEPSLSEVRINCRNYELPMVHIFPLTKSIKVHIEYGRIWHEHECTEKFRIFCRENEFKEDVFVHQLKQIFLGMATAASVATFLEKDVKIIDTALKMFGGVKCQ